MTKCKFKVGDRVRPTKDNRYNITGKNMEVGMVTYVGKCGASDDDDMKIRVLKHKIEDWEGYEYSVNSCKFEKIGEETIVIYRKDNKVIAFDKSTGKKTEACCNPEDEFNFHTGAKLAFSRLMGEPENTKERKTKVKEVKRPAKIGEYIKIVRENAIFNHTKYKNGDIIKVKNICNILGSRAVWLSGNIGDYIDESEYVVLENYVPEEEQAIPEELKDAAKQVVDFMHALEKEGLPHCEALDFVKELIPGKRG